MKRDAVSIALRSILHILIKDSCQFMRGRDIQGREGTHSSGIVNRSILIILIASAKVVPLSLLHYVERMVSSVSSIYPLESKQECSHQCFKKRMRMLL